MAKKAQKAQKSAPIGGATFDAAKFGRSLVEAGQAQAAGIAAAEQAIVKARSTYLMRLVALAPAIKGCTEQQWDTTLAPVIKSEYTTLGYKDVPTRAAMLKVAMLGLANGIEPPKGCSGVADYVNKTARAALQANGVIKAKASGRKASATKSVAREHAADKALEVAIATIAKHGLDKSASAQFKVRRAALAHLVGSPEGWQAIIALAASEAAKAGE